MVCQYADRLLGTAVRPRTFVYVLDNKRVTGWGGG